MPDLAAADYEFRDIVHRGEAWYAMPLAWAVKHARANSIWPFTFGLACCAIEMMATAATRFDLDRFGAGVFRATPRQCDLMIVAGTVTYKMAERVERLWHQMAEPRWVISMGACATNGGPYDPHGYHVVRGVDLVVPVNVYVPGCPPRPESLIEAVLLLEKQIIDGEDRLVRRRWEIAHREQAERLAGLKAEYAAAGKVGGAERPAGPVPAAYA